MSHKSQAAVRLLDSRCAGQKFGSVVRVLSAQTGEESASLITPTDSEVTSFILHKDRVIIGSLDGALCCFKLVSQALLWKHGPSDHPWENQVLNLFIHRSEDPEDDSHDVVIVFTKTHVIGRSCLTGNELWTLDFPLTNDEQFLRAIYLAKSKELVVLVTSSEPHFPKGVLRFAIPSVTTQMSLCFPVEPIPPQKVTAGKEEWNLPDLLRFTDHFEVSEDGKVLCVANINKLCVKKWGSSEFTSFKYDTLITSITMGADYLAVGTRKGRIHFYHMDNLQPVWNDEELVHGHLDLETRGKQTLLKDITQLRFHPIHCHILFSSGADGSIRCWMMPPKNKQNDKNNDQKCPEVKIDIPDNDTHRNLIPPESFSQAQVYVQTNDVDIEIGQHGRITSPGSKDSPEITPASQPTSPPPTKLRTELGLRIGAHERGFMKELYFDFFPAGTGLVSVDDGNSMNCWDIAFNDNSPPSVIGSEQRWRGNTMKAQISDVQMFGDELFIVGDNNGCFLQKWKVDVWGVKHECCWTIKFPYFVNHAAISILVTKTLVLWPSSTLHAIDRETGAMRCVVFQENVAISRALAVGDEVVVSVSRSVSASNTTRRTQLQAWNIQKFADLSYQVRTPSECVSPVWRKELDCMEYLVTLIPSTNREHPPILVIPTLSKKICLIETAHGQAVREFDINDVVRNIFPIRNGVILRMNDGKMIALVLPQNLSVNESSDIYFSPLDLLIPPSNPIGKVLSCGLNYLLVVTKSSLQCYKGDINEKHVDLSLHWTKTVEQDIRQAIIDESREAVLFSYNRDAFAVFVSDGSSFFSLKGSHLFNINRMVCPIDPRWLLTVTSREIQAHELDYLHRFSIACCPFDYITEERKKKMENKDSSVASEKVNNAETQFYEQVFLNKSISFFVATKEKTVAWCKIHWRVLSFYQSIVFFLVSFFQVAGFAFSIVPPPTVYKHFQSALDGFRRLISSATESDSSSSSSSASIPFEAYVYVCWGLVLLLSLWFVFHDKVLFNRVFLSPTSKWRFVANALNWCTKVITRPLLIPIMSTLLETFRCTMDAGGAGRVLSAQQNIGCLSPRHLGLLIPSVVALYLLIVQAIRLNRSSGRIECIEYRGLLLDSTRDQIADPVINHPLSYHSRNFLLLLAVSGFVFVIIEGFASAAVGSALNIFVAMIMLIGSVFTRTFDDVFFNDVHLVLRGLVVWNFCVALIALHEGNQSTPVYALFWVELALGLVGIYASYWRVDLGGYLLRHVMTLVEKLCAKQKPNSA